MIVVPWCQPFRTLESFEFFQSFLAAETGIGVSLFQKSVYMIAVYLKSFGLPIRSKFTTNPWPLINIQSRPFQHLQQVRFCCFNQSVAIRVFETEDKTSLVLPSEKPAKQCRP